MATKTPRTPRTVGGATAEERAALRVKNLTDVLWHAATFVIVNAFFWLIVPGAAFWISLVWGIALAFHIAYYFIGDDGPENRRYQAFLAQEKARDRKP